MALIRELWSDTTAFAKQREAHAASQPIFLQREVQAASHPIFVSEKFKQLLTHFSSAYSEKFKQLLIHVLLWPIDEERWRGPQIISGILMVIGKK